MRLCGNIIIISFSIETNEISETNIRIKNIITRSDISVEVHRMNIIDISVYRVLLAY